MAGSAGRANAQSSAGYSLVPATLQSFGGLGTSTGYALVGEAGRGAGPGRSSSAAYDEIGGFVGGAFSSRATVSYAMTGGSYKSVAFPVNDANNAPASILSELGGVNNTSWRIGHWSPVDSAYQEPGTALNLATIGEGLGYWLVTKGSTTVASTGLPAPVQPFTLALSGGANDWQQIGNPFLFPVLVSRIQVTDGSTTRFLTDPMNILTEQVVKSWNGTAFANTGVLDGRTGYFLHKLVAGPVSIIFPYASTSLGSPAPALVKPAGALWAVAISAKQSAGAGEAEPLFVGAAEVAANSWNPLDLSLAPAPPGMSPLQLSIGRHDLGAMSGSFVRDFEPAADAMSWDFTVSGEAPDEAELSFTGFDLPSTTRLYLSDLVAGWKREIQPGDLASVAVAAGGRRYRLEASGAGSVASGVSMVDGARPAYPNPFRTSTGLSFTLARGGDIHVEIFDVQGRVVRSLDRPGLSAGEHVLPWDGTSAQGSMLRSGVYLARWRAGSAHGTSRIVRIQ